MRNHVTELCAQRVRRICLSPENHDNYKALFDLGYQNADDLRSQYAAAFGDSYEYMVPELGALLAAVSTDTRDYSYERDICDDVKLFHGMTLDMARSPPRRRAAAPLFLAHRTARYAPSRAGHRELRVCHPARRLLARGHRGHRDLYQLHPVEASRRSVRPTPYHTLTSAADHSSLPAAQHRFEYDVSPPPPPPGQASLYEFVLREDPLFYEDMRIKMEEWYPRSR